MVDRATREIYESRAGDWVARRKAEDLDALKRLVRGQPGPSVDLGCGPGWHAAALPGPAVALDAARAMLDRVPEFAPNALRVQGDLEHLPFRPQSLATAWARNSYVHLPRTSIPLAFAELQRSLRVGARFTIRLFLGENEGYDTFPDSEFGGRYFSFWRLDELQNVVVGGGFDIVRTRTLKGEYRDIQVECTRARTLPDVVGPDMRMLVCGLNPSLYSADAGVGFARPGNRFWPAALLADVATVDRDPWHALRHHGIGFTDLVKRATVAAAELTRDEYRDGLARVERLVEWLQPRIVAFVGLAGWRAAVNRSAVAGHQDESLGGRPVYVMPSSSGLNAHSSVTDLADHLTAALALV
ncbi:MAG TPA: uracil-DNA glycosylase family protein [Acidimicrobiales bacterium]|nr:uracil-DNA glycosylase family protein [Acidimicrobiales bacterium]